jgi:hypothetical protein
MSEIAKPIPVAKPPEKKMTVLEQIKKLDEQRAKLLEDAKTEALKKAEDAISELKALGFSYSLAEGDSKPKGKTKSTRQRDPNKPCSVCGYVTDPPHDGRLHRNQDPKKPFTAKELGELGLTKQ